MEINIWGTELEPIEVPQPEPSMVADKDTDCLPSEPARKTLLGLIIPLFLKPEQKAASDCD